jgi:hypothetical protein
MGGETSTLRCEEEMCCFFAEEGIRVVPPTEVTLKNKQTNNFTTQTNTNNTNKRTMHWSWDTLAREDGRISRANKQCCAQKEHLTKKYKHEQIIFLFKALFTSRFTSRFTSYVTFLLSYLISKHSFHIYFTSYFSFTSYSHLCFHVTLETIVFTFILRADDDGHSDCSELEELGFRACNVILR